MSNGAKEYVDIFGRLYFDKISYLKSLYLTFFKISFCNLGIKSNTIA